MLIGVSASSKAELLQMLSRRAAASLGISNSDILGALQNREDLGSTGIGAGIAIPHAPVEGITSPFTLLIRLAKPIAFQAIDDEPVDVVCLILTPPGEQVQFLKLLSSISRQLRCPDSIRTIRTAADARQIYATITQCD